MNKVNLPHDIESCLKHDMQINMEHLLSAYDSFDDIFKLTANSLLLGMHESAIKLKTLSPGVHFYESGDGEQNEFMQSLYDCFQLYCDYEGLELHKSLYEHINRGGNNWFPIVSITRSVEDYSYIGQPLTIYRGCSLEEYNTKRFRQSWTTNIEIAKTFAFRHFSMPNNTRVVIEADINSSEIAWMRSGENEVVILPNASLQHTHIAMSFEQHCEE